MSKNILQKMTESNLNISNCSYKFYTSKEITLQQELNNTPKIFKNKRIKLQKQIEDTQAKANKYFDYYLENINDLYNIDNEDNKKEVNNDI